MANIAITGANRGIGLELCRELAARGDQVFAVCRKTSPGLVVLGVQIVEGVDVSTDAGISRCAETMAQRRLDVLVNNAGILEPDNLDALDPESIRRQFEVNALAPLRLTRALLPCLGRGSKVIMVTSRMGSIGDNASGGSYGYRMSKAALNMASMSLARDLSGRGIAVATLHPGMVATEMTGRHGIPVQEAASGLIARIDELALATTGRFLHQNGQELPW